MLRNQLILSFRANKSTKLILEFAECGIIIPKISYIYIYQLNKKIQSKNLDKLN